MAKIVKEAPEKKTAAKSTEKKKKSATVAKKPTVVKKTTKPAATKTKKVTPKNIAEIPKPTAKKAVTPKTPEKKAAVSEKTSPKAKTRISAVDVIAQAMLDKKAQQVVSLDLTELDTAICDYFVICHADSTTQVQAIADNVEKEMFEQIKEWPMRMQGKENAFWIIVDYGDIVVHIFQTEYRRFYRLEELWADAVHKIHDDTETKHLKK
jgi:ribosome-associated protein